MNTETFTSKSFYKYRSLKNLKWFLDILMNRRLYASKYLNLNDPMEGFFRYDSVSNSIIKKLRDDRANTLICSLSETYRNGLMWSVYADEHKGCCIELEVTSKGWTPIVVNYNKFKATITEKDASVEKILSVKSPQWEHEKEIRYIKTNPNSPYLKISINKIYFGAKMSRGDFSFYKQLIETINKTLPKDKQIGIEKLKKEDLDFGFI